jgi:ADP-dependent NAD(P)H-hydrate dehydratase / NAD(P)H-hydrate epimerase
MQSAQRDEEEPVHQTERRACELMRHYYSADAIRDAEAPLLASLPDGALMRRAAYGLAAAIAVELTARTGGVAGRRICAVVGSGDNGGDALWAATFLRRRGAAADAVLLKPERTHQKGLAAFTQAGGRIVDRVAKTTDLVIDGVVGISGSGPLRPDAAEVFAGADDAAIPVVAVDIPSGIDVETGAITGPAVHAALTVTFGGLKPVHALADCGRVKLVDIGLDLPSTDVLGFEAADVAARWPVPGPHDDKYTQGVTGVMAGSSTYPGAAVLCTGAAVAATSGMVRYTGSAHSEVLAHWPEVIASPTPAAAGRVQAWVVGPGLGTEETGAAALWFALETDLPVLVDADGLTILAAHPDLLASRRAPTVLTPHAGEFARLAGAPPGDDRVGATRKLADALGVTVLLKGNVTVIAEPGGPIYLNPAGQSWAATAGSGDLLSGMIGALLAAGLPAAEAAAAGAFVHAHAAALSAADPGPGDAPTSASRIVGHIRAALATL